jgi:hypothetical protein
MTDDAHQEVSLLRLAMYQLGKLARALLNAIAAWYWRRRHADTSIAWEDGDMSGGSRR